MVKLYIEGILKLYLIRLVCLYTIKIIKFHFDSITLPTELNLLVAANWYYYYYLSFDLIRIIINLVHSYFVIHLLIILISHLIIIFITFVSYSYSFQPLKFCFHNYFESLYHLYLVIVHMVISWCLFFILLLGLHVMYYLNLKNDDIKVVLITITRMYVNINY